MKFVLKYSKYYLVILLIGMVGKASAQSTNTFIEALAKPNHWADSVLKRLTKKQRIAQLFFVRAHTDKGKAYEDSIARIIKKEKIGGLVFFQGGPVRQALLTQHYQAISKTPLLVAMDAEWGVGMRLDSCISYPYQMTLGAIQNNLLIEQMGSQIARDMTLLGMHINFAPVLDINNNAQNPVIGFRSFGDNKYKVADKAGAYLRGMQQGQILTSLKHFPGHGDTDVDSHYDLPQLPFSKTRLDSLELYPFKQLIAAGAAGVMVAHMNIPALDPTANIPSTLSEPIVTGLLKSELGFKGLVFSDAMGMKGVVKYFPDGEADVRGLIAGNDVLELSENSKRAIKLVRKAIRTKRLSWARINQSVHKVLVAKHWAGLHTAYQADISTLVSQLQRPEALALNQQLADEAITLLGSTFELDQKKKTCILSIGPDGVTVFQNELRPFFDQVSCLNIAKNASAVQIQEIRAQLATAEQVILSLHDTRKRPAPSLDFSAEIMQLIADLGPKCQATVVFANAYTLAQLPENLVKKPLLLAYQNSQELQKAATKVLNKSRVAKGKLPVRIAPYFTNGEGL